MKKLLFIEDESYVIARVDEILKNFPQFEVTRTDKARDASIHLETGAFDIIITDIYLRGISGLELLYMAKKANKDACVILITGIENTDLASKALKEGALDFVIKPPGLERLANILKLVTMVKL
ncbi:MAG: response regulator [Elusimicrobia bacterium]|nr:response regulator [Elusimicrobiota bacterium]